MRRLVVFAVVALFSANVVGQDRAKPKPATTKQAADKVLAAFKVEDGEALKALAEKDKPDPWLVADELCFRGEYDAAESFAEAAPRKDTEKLPAYVASRRGEPRNAATRKARAAARKAIRARDPKAALAAIEAVDTTPYDVVSLDLLYARSYVLRSLRRLDESAKAYLATADAAERLGWLARAASALHHSGESAELRSDWRGALAVRERRLVLQRSRGNRAGVAATLINIGTIHDSLGDYPKALEYHERGLRLAEAIGHREWAANALNNIGVIHARLGDYPKALDFYGRSLEINEELGDGAGIAVDLNNIGNVHMHLGDDPKALDFYGRSLKIREELRDRAGIAASLINIGNIHRLGDNAKALEYYERGLEVAEAIGHREWAANALGGIGNIYQRLGDHARALEFQGRSLEIREEIGDRAGIAWSLHMASGRSTTSLGDYAKALDFLRRSLEDQR